MQITYQENEEFVERSFLILLIVITITQFASWGHQSVRYILTTIFPVVDQVRTTQLDVLIGFGAMVGSTMVFTGALLWWRRMRAASRFITWGSLVFMGKNILDIINETILFGMAYQKTITMADIDRLAANLGEQFFQLAFWVFIFFYFRHLIREHIANHTVAGSAPTQTEPPPKTFTPSEMQ
jgi:hypothetical protein